jgi:hypothetical protein
MEPKFELTYKEVLPGVMMEVTGLVINAIEARHTLETNPLAIRVAVDNREMTYTDDGEITDELVR